MCEWKDKFLHSYIAVISWDITICSYSRIPFQCSPDDTGPWIMPRGAPRLASVFLPVARSSPLPRRLAFAEDRGGAATAEVAASSSLRQCVYRSGLVCSPIWKNNQLAREAHGTGIIRRRLEGPGFFRVRARVCATLRARTNTQDTIVIATSLKKHTILSLSLSLHIPSAV